MYQIMENKTLVTNVEKIICNCCKKEIDVKNGILQGDVLTVEKRWNYFSEKDNEVHRFDICEECYDKFVQSFQIPIEIE